ncbi:MAG TPA: hypothetical protein VGN63_19500 [Flavisolibacter sp.]|jgi:hypothetical protein|nr:hypothetical protein [Flavisolibacter sp.]
MEETQILSPIPLDQLRQVFSDVVRQEIIANELQKLQERLLSADETCKLFTPAITRPTLESYASKGYFTKYYLAGRTWYKYSEVIGALKSIKRYSHD